MVQTTCPPMRMSHAEWRALALHDVPKPVEPEYIPGLPGVNRQLAEEYRGKLIYYILCRTERLLHGIPQEEEIKRLGINVALEMAYAKY